MIKKHIANAIRKDKGTSLFTVHHHNHSHDHPCPGMHRPWDQREGGGGGGLQQGEGGRGNKASPLDALFNMISNNDALTAKSGKLNTL